MTYAQTIRGAGGLDHAWAGIHQARQDVHGGRYTNRAASPINGHG